MADTDGYRTDLAYVHDRGFGHFASGAGLLLVAELQRRGFFDGTVVDVGCGSGITATLLVERGYRVLGIDRSEALLEIARRRVPQVTFRKGSFVDLDVPPSVAVCAIGEVLNYDFDHRSSPAARAHFFRRVFAALAPGGLLLLDAARPDRAPERPTRNFFEDEDWAVLVETSAEAAVLTRRITTFRRAGGAYRRDFEVHRLRLVPPEEIVSELEHVGFRVEVRRSYGDETFPPGLHGFLACKPA